MKPRLEACEYTEEDTRIHLRHFYAPRELAHWGGTLFGRGRAQDKRDADLMYEFADCRKICGPTSIAIVHHILRAHMAGNPDQAIWIGGHPVFLV